MRHLVVRASERDQPDVQARIARAKADTLLRPLDRLFAPPAVKVHLSKQDMGCGEARVEPDRLLERRNAAFGTACIHAGQTRSETAIGIARVEGHGPSRQIVRLLE